MMSFFDDDDDPDKYYSCMFLEWVANSFSRGDSETDFYSLQMYSFSFVVVLAFGLKDQTFFP